MRGTRRVKKILTCKLSITGDVKIYRTPNCTDTTKELTLLFTAGSSNSTDTTKELSLPFTAGSSNSTDTTKELSLPFTAGSSNLKLKIFHPWVFKFLKLYFQYMLLTDECRTL